MGYMNQRQLSSVDETKVLRKLLERYGIFDDLPEMFSNRTEAENFIKEKQTTAEILARKLGLSAKGLTDEIRQRIEEQFKDLYDEGSTRQDFTLDSGPKMPSQTEPRNRLGL